MRAFSQGSSTSFRHRKANLPQWLAAFTAAVLLVTLATGTATAATGAPTATDDPTVVSDWNEIAVTTLAGDTTKQGVENFLYMGFVQAAVYDAVVGVDGRYEPTGSMPGRRTRPPSRQPRWRPPTRSW